MEGLLDRLGIRLHNRRMPIKFYSATEAANVLGISRARMNELIHDGRFPGAIRQGRRWLLPVKEVDGYKRKPHRGKQRKRTTD